MKKILFTFVLAVFASGLFAQENVFLNRDYWGGNPSVEEVKAKIKEGNDPLAFNRSHFNGITNAILANAPTKTIEYLLSQKDVDINLRTHDARTYLIWAAYAGNYDIVKYLVDRGADVSLKGSHGYGAITFAANAGVEDKRIYNYLTKNGLSIEQETLHGATAILLIMQKLQDVKMINYFEKKGLDLHSKDADGNGAFSYAAKGGNIKVMNALIERKVDYNSKNNLGGNAILAASEGARGSSPKLETFEYLVKKGVEPNVVNTKGETPIILLSRGNKDASLIQFFLDKKVDANLTNEEGNNALMQASAGNSLEIVKLLEENTKNVNHQNNNGETALMMAVKSNSTDVVAYLIKQGAKLDLQDKDGNNLVYYWANSGKRAKNGRNTPPNKETLELLKENGLEVTKAQPNGNTLLHVAVQNNNLRLTKQAIKWGVNVNAKNKEGNTALLTAALNSKNGKILTYLVEKGADKSITTDFEESAYDLVKENEVLSKNLEAFQFLK